MVVVGVDDACASAASGGAVADRCREAAERPGLRHVRVDHLRPEIAKDVEQLRDRDRVRSVQSLYGTSVRNNDTGLRVSTITSIAPWQKVAHSPSGLVWLNEPPRPDPRALLVAGGTFVAVASLCQLVSRAYARLPRTHVDSSRAPCGKSGRCRRDAYRRAATPESNE